MYDYEWRPNNKVIAIMQLKLLHHPRPNLFEAEMAGDSGALVIASKKPDPAIEFKWQVSKLLVICGWLCMN